MMGQSGGRSGGNPNGKGTSRRATPRERAGVDPYGLPSKPKIRWTDRAYAIVDYLMVGAFGAFAGAVIAHWLG